MSKLSAEELSAVLGQTGIEVGEQYRHVKSGGEYVVLCASFDVATQRPVIVYAPQDPKLLGYSVTFTRDAEDFRRKFVRI